MKFRLHARRFAQRLRSEAKPRYHPAMFDVDEVIQLKEGERVQAMVRKHFSMILPALILSGGLIVVPFFFLFTFVRFGSVGIILFAILIAIGLFVALKTFYIWDAGVFVVTNQRLVKVDQRSLWNRAVSEIALRDVRDLQWERRGIRDTLSKMGTIRVKTGSSSSPDLIVNSIPAPDQVLRLIQELRDHHLKGHSDGVHAHESRGLMEEKKEELQQLIANADEKTLERVQELLKHEKTSE